MFMKMSVYVCLCVASVCESVCCKCMRSFLALSGSL